MRLHALPLLVGTLCVLAIAYRFYSAFVAARVLCLDPARRTPAHERTDGKDFVPVNRFVLFGHHFAAITGAGPLIGPVLAAQFGFLPGLLWILIGVTLGGAVHDFVILCASVRRGGMSLAEIARTELGPVAGIIASIAIFFTVTIAISAMGFAVVKILEASPWATFTIGMTIPIALLMGGLMRGGTRLVVASALGVALLVLSVYFGQRVAASAVAPALTFGFHQLVYLLVAYGFCASVLPVWLLLVPRDYLSSYMKLGTVLLLLVGIMLINPELRLPALTQYIHGGGPIIKGHVFPFVFITVACGAISGFHSLIASGTTPKMVDREPDCRLIGYGAMLMEGLVGITSLVAASCLFPADYFAINVPPAAFHKLGLSPVELEQMSQLIGEDLRGRTGGSVSLAAGMAAIFAQWPRFRGMLDYFYHFVVMFEAVFILTTVDAGTRVARFLVQELLARIDRRFLRHDWQPGVWITSALVVAGWGTFLYTGTIQTLWPLLGIANQLLATTALAVGTAVIWGLHPTRSRYALVTLVPMLVVGTTTLTAGWQSIFGIFLRLPSRAQAAIDAGVTALLMLCTVAVVGALAIRLSDGLRRLPRAV
ncbi:MAG: carbon starvation protein A [Myxococcales bacterium]|nr:carbon starvation protein A [Myxococcota bacterium]MDW8282607.1 carbon starvation protein A [Myxococcales bacterium]